MSDGRWQMANGRWQRANEVLRSLMIQLIFLLVVGGAQAGEPFVVLELFTSQG